MIIPTAQDQVDKCAAEIAKATVPFYTISQRKVFQERSGVLLRVGTKHFVLTCAHEINEHYKKHNLPAFIGRPTSGSGCLIRLQDCFSIRIEKFDVDLAVIELCQSVVEQLLVTNRFVGIAEIDLLAYAQPAFYLILGFPSEDTEVNYIERDIKTKGLWYVTFLYRGKLNPHSNFNPDIHLLLNFEKTGLAHDGETSKIPHPRGLSGCGIWRLTESESWENWKPEHMKLVAIQHRYDEHRNYVMGSWVRHAMQMVWHRYKELRPGMQIQIPQSG